nr:uncharacterized protein LOC110364230 [Columba livia]
MISISSSISECSSPLGVCRLTGVPVDVCVIQNKQLAGKRSAVTYARKQPAGLEQHLSSGFLLELVTVPPQVAPQLVEATGNHLTALGECFASQKHLLSSRYLPRPADPRGVNPAEPSWESVGVSGTLRDRGLAEETPGSSLPCSRFQGSVLSPGRQNRGPASVVGETAELTLRHRQEPSRTTSCARGLGDLEAGPTPAALGLIFTTLCRATVGFKHSSRGLGSAQHLQKDKGQRSPPSSSCSHKEKLGVCRRIVWLKRWKWSLRFSFCSVNSVSCKSNRTLMKIPKEISLNIKVHLKEKEVAGHFAQKDLAL